MANINDALKSIAQAIELIKIYDDDNADKAIELLQQAIDALAQGSM